MRQLFLAVVFVFLSVFVLVKSASADPVTTWARVTAYTSCDASIAAVKKCDGITASGRYVEWGTAACGRQWPFGTKVLVPGTGVFTCWDRGGGIGNGHVDLWFPSYAAAVQWGGLKYQDVTFILPNEWEQIAHEWGFDE